MSSNDGSDRSSLIVSDSEGSDHSSLDHSPSPRPDVDMPDHEQMGNALEVIATNIRRQDNLPGTALNRRILQELQAFRADSKRRFRRVQRKLDNIVKCIESA